MDAEYLKTDERRRNAKPDTDRKPDMVNHPPHYATTRIECIDALGAMVEHWPGEPAFLAANVVKYVWRHRQKAPVESLRKARWYLDRLIAHAEAQEKSDV